MPDRVENKRIMNSPKLPHCPDISNKLHPSPAYFSLFSLFQPIPSVFSILQPFLPIPAYLSLFQPILAYSSPFMPI